MSRFVHLLHCFAQDNPNRKRITYLCGNIKLSSPGMERIYFDNAASTALD